MTISDLELNIFARQLILKEFDEKTFNYIQNQHVTIVGMGGIGCPLTQYLILSGIKKLTLVDNDQIKVSNLNRQTLYSIKDIRKKKVEIAKKKLLGFNPKIEIKTISKKITKTNIENNLSQTSVIIDATDNWRTMNLINKFCVDKYIPLISASVIGFDGQVVFFKNNKKSHLCMNCIFPNKIEPDLPRCDTSGVTGIAAGLTGLIAAQITLNFFIKNSTLEDKIIMIRSKSMLIDQIKIKKNNNCSNID